VRNTGFYDEPDHGLTDEVLAETDVLTWWAHVTHGQVKDEVVDRVQQRVLNGMGLILLHSSHFSKIFKRLMGTGCYLKHRGADEKERLWCTDPSHPIAEGIPDHFELPQHEMYGEPFGIPKPDSVVFISWFAGGEVFRSGCTFTRERGRVFYFSPGHESNPIYRDEHVLRIIANACRWAALPAGPALAQGHFPNPLENSVRPEGS